MAPSRSSEIWRSLYRQVTRLRALCTMWIVITSAVVFLCAFGPNGQLMVGKVTMFNLASAPVDHFQYLDEVAQTDQKLALLTGGAGFVGRHFTHRLCTSGYHVVIVDNLISESALHPSQWPAHLQCPASTYTFIREDCRKFFAVIGSQQPWDLFIHLAAVVGGRQTIEGSPLVVADDLSIDAAAFQWAIDTRGGQKPQPRKMIYFSSSAAYPVRYQYQDSGIRLAESMLRLDNTDQDIGFPDLTYGWAKLTGEYLAHVAHESRGLNVAVYRPMSGYGEDQDEVYPFKAILKRALNQEDPIMLWSNATRDFMYIGDIVECVLDSMDTVEDAEPINLATGVATSFSDLASLMARQVGYEPSLIDVMDGKPAGVAYRVGDADHMRQHKCHVYTSIEEGTAVAIQFMRGEPMQSMAERIEAHRLRSTSLASSPPERARGQAGKPLTTEESAHVYSHFRCIGGSQTFPGITLQKTQVGHGWPEANVDGNRVCLFENVCWVDDHLVFYEDPSLRAITPDFLWPESFTANGGDLVHLNYLGTKWSPVIEKGPLPKEAPLNSSVTFLFGQNSYSDNFGHLLIDDLIPALQGLSVFNLPLDHGLLLFSDLCENLGSKDINPYVNRPRKEVCLDNFRVYTPLVMGRPAVDMMEEWKGQTICMKNLIAGHSSTFSLRTLDVERGPSIRSARDRIVQHLGLAGLPRPTAQSIMVLVKKPGFIGAPTWPTLCEDTKVAMEAIDPSIPVRCFDPIQQDVMTQVKNSLESTIVIAEHGTTSYGALYGHDGTVLLSIADRAQAKEVQINLYATHYDTYYFAHEDRETHFEGILRFTLTRAASNFGTR